MTRPERRTSRWSQARGAPGRSPHPRSRRRGVLLYVALGLIGTLFIYASVLMYTGQWSEKNAIFVYHSEVITNLAESAKAWCRDLGRPLRAFAWPYLLLLALLCAEWVFRRRSGLR